MNTNKAKHTPGPWKISEKGPGKMSIHLGDFTNDSPGTHLATFYSDRGFNNGLLNSEMRANVSLCAAAPELLAALENVLAALNDMRHCAINGQEPGAELRGKVREIELAGEAALMKAKGDK